MNTNRTEIDVITLNNLFVVFLVIVANQTNTILHIPIETEYTAVVIRINTNRDPLLVYVGKRLINKKEYEAIPSFDATQQDGDYTGLYGSAYTSSGTRNLLEPAIQVIHADGNPSLELKYVSHEQDLSNQSHGIALTTML